MAEVVSDPFIGSYPITQNFGQNPQNYAQFGIQGHDGVDFALPSGTPLLAPVSGTVVNKSFDPNGYGWFAEIWDPSQNIMTLQAHADSFSVNKGDVVTAGQQVGLSGNTGFSTGPHLHFAVGDTNSAGQRINTQNGYAGWVNPLDSSKVNWNIQNPSAPRPGVIVSPAPGVAPTPAPPTTIAPGSYQPQNLTQAQRDYLYHFFGHSGQAPVGYGGEGGQPGGGSIAPGSYPPQNLSQAQRQSLWEHFGHSGQAPVGYGGETPGGRVDTPQTNTEGIPVGFADGSPGVYLKSQQGEVRLTTSVAELAKFGWNNLGFLKAKQIGGYEWSFWSGNGYEGNHSRCGDSKWCSDEQYDRDFGGQVASVEIRRKVFAPIPVAPPAPPPPPKTGAFFVDSKPQGARVLIDGEALPSLTPISRDVLLTPGEHQIIVELEGYDQFVEKINLAPGAMYNKTIQLQKIVVGAQPKRPPTAAVSPAPTPPFEGVPTEFNRWEAPKPPTTKDLFDRITDAVNRLLREIGLKV